ncbi:anti-sigma factor [Arsenicibacter rosenii]|uniref:Regulator of SigK n=1 Tax=Arsenicibacter rosenii TaxID=1750698 RepID=A0A1S2VKC4_9BACT|nr:anti-sigma factor [Arsenicibacter rosenii]OIN59212.1 anti-sigma factor [Arsenicibacter rosenii]
MNVAEYIASGTLEAYILGAASDQERREVECLSSIYPEIKQELDQLALALEDYAMALSVEPPVALREQIMSQLTFGVTQKTTAADEEEPETKVLPMPDTRPIYNFTWIAAASVGLLLLAFSFFLITRLRDNQQALASLRSTNAALQQDINALKTQQSSSSQVMALLRQPGTQIIQLKGNEKAPDGNLAVYWNQQTGQLALDISSLPALPSSQQYQLWTLKGGKPFDAGVFDPITGVHHLHPIQQGTVDAFAITIEQRGGSPTPHLESLIAMTPTKAS